MNGWLSVAVCVYGLGLNVSVLQKHTTSFGLCSGVAGRSVCWLVVCWCHSQNQLEYVPLSGNTKVVWFELCECATDTERRVVFMKALDREGTGGTQSLCLIVINIVVAWFTVGLVGANC